MVSDCVTYGSMPSEVRLEIVLTNIVCLVKTLYSANSFRLNLTLVSHAKVESIFYIFDTRLHQTKSYRRCKKIIKA